jgi:hypothetical protein
MSTPPAGVQRAAISQRIFHTMPSRPTSSPRMLQRMQYFNELLALEWPRCIGL